MALLPRGCRLGPKQSLYKICSLGCMAGCFFFLFPLARTKVWGNTAKVLPQHRISLPSAGEVRLPLPHRSCNTPHGPRGSPPRGDPRARGRLNVLAMENPSQVGSAVRGEAGRGPAGSRLGAPSHAAPSHITPSRIAPSHAASSHVAPLACDWAAFAGRGVCCLP